MTMQKENRQPRAVSAAQLGLALICVAAAGAGVIVLLGFIVLLGTGTVSPDGQTEFLGPLTIDIAWLAMFALQHSGMVRPAFKRWWTRIVPAHLERVVYAGASGVLTLLLPVWWQPLPGEPLWDLPAAVASVALLAAVALGILVLWFNPFDFVGVLQLW